MKRELEQMHWNLLIDTSPSAAALELQSALLSLMEKHIPHEVVQIRSGSHPWFNDICMNAVKEKRLAWGTDSQREKSELCSEVLFEQYLEFIQVTKAKLRSFKRGSKQWWKESKKLKHKSSSACGIPALRHSDGVTWARSSTDKAELLSETFQSKWVLPPVQPNVYSDIPTAVCAPDCLLPIRSRKVSKFL